MCTLVSISKATWDAAPTVWAARVLADARSNPHGLAMLLARASGDYTSIRTQDPDVVVGTLATAKWTRVWLHSRYGTGGGNVLENTHGFCSQGVWYMHNGFIRQAPASSMPVDSMAIGKWIAEGTVYDKLFQESYANVFLVAPWSGLWSAVRGGPGGQLHTDGAGNFSTVPTGDVTQPVLPGTKLSYHCPKHVEYKWSAPSYTTPGYRPGSARLVGEAYDRAPYGGRESAPPLDTPMPSELQASQGSTAVAILPSESPIPAPPVVYATAQAYWAAITRGDIEFNAVTYRDVCRKQRGY